MFGALINWASVIAVGIAAAFGGPVVLTFGLATTADIATMVRAVLIRDGVGVRLAVAVTVVVNSAVVVVRVLVGG